MRFLVSLAVGAAISGGIAVPTVAGQLGFGVAPPAAAKDGKADPPDRPKPGAEKDGAKARTLFADLYGKEYERLLASKNGSEKVAFAKKLMAAAAEVAKEDPTLSRLLREKAADLAATHASGYALAAELLAELAADAPVKVALLERLVALREKVIDGMRVSERPKAAEELIAAYRELVVELLREHKFASATRVVDKAKLTAHAYLRRSKELAAELEKLSASVARQQRTYGKIESAVKTLAEKPDDPAANLAVGLYKLFEDNDAQAAAPHLAKSDDAGCRKLGAALAKSEAGIELADAYRAAGQSTAAHDFKTPLLGRAVRLYKTVLEDEPKHPEAARIKLILTQLADVPAVVETPGSTAKPSVFAAVKAAVKASKVSDTRMMGSGRIDFRDLPPGGGGGILVGFDVTYGEFAGNATIKTVQPIYLTPKGKVFGVCYGARGPKGGARVVAKPGYAVGGITVKAGLGIDGFSVTFMELKGDALNVEKSYKSAWLGGRGGNAETPLAGDGSLVVGIFGKVNTSRTDPAVNGLGLVTLPKAE